MLTTVWTVFLKQTEDPAFYRRRFKHTLGNTTAGQRWAFMLIGTGAVVLLQTGQLIFTSCLYFGFLTLVHSVLHDPFLER